MSSIVLLLLQPWTKIARSDRPVRVLPILKLWVFQDLPAGVVQAYERSLQVTWLGLRRSKKRTCPPNPRAVCGAAFWFTKPV